VRVSRNFAFIDLSGFTKLTEAEGDERAVAVLSGFRTLVRDICSRRGVRIAKWLGDGAMLVNVEATPVVAATLEMQFAVAQGEEPAQIRCGVSAGPVILLEGDDYIGHSVNVAARLCDLAASGEVLATPAIVEHLPKWAAVLSTEDRMVRGLENAIPVARIGLRPLHGAVAKDPVCHIPLSKEVAEMVDRDTFGEEVLFCSDSCYDTWERRPRQAPEGQGSLRTPLIGS
jgi:class 3 adenylate cyclase